MTTRIKILFLGTAVSLLFAGSAVQAQEAGQNLTEDEIRSFFDTMEQNTTEAIQAGDFERLLQWAQDSIADEATFSVSNEIYQNDERKSFTIVSLDKEDVTRLGRAAAGMMSHMQGQPVHDYSLDIEITDFTPIGPEAATVTAEFTESGTLSMQQAQTADAAETDDALQTGPTETDTEEADAGDAAVPASDRSLRIEATAQCSHVVHRGESDDQLVIGLSTCQARTNLQPSSG